ncbi:hypothetical protein [Amycolatopsis sp. NBC_01286]|uniref:hypothetical protein n=1 Tax=Amycolatopsis sp. NBC_01286 TaxID=2903560 RepID=UPI002E128707|nr:hypothetical protein OG570_30970 [Amycolatopsis sp. NBC_01286]
MTGFHADPAALDALAVRLEDTADEFAAAAADVEATASGDLGPQAVAAALTALTGEWSGRIRAVGTDYAATADSVHAAAKAFRGADASAAEALGRITAQPGSDDPGQTTTQPHQPADAGQPTATAPSQTAAQPHWPADADQTPAPGQTTTQPHWPAEPDQGLSTDPGQTTAQPHQPADADQTLSDNLGQTPTRRTDPGGAHRFGPAVFGDSGRADG